MTPDPNDQLAAAIEAAQRWAIHDPDPITRGTVDVLVDAGSTDLVELFTGRIQFGTAGLRAEVGVGPNRMNALVVRQTTLAVVQWLQAGGIAAPAVLIGFDARRDSQRFAAHAAAAVQAGGGRPLRSDIAAPTPVFAHALLDEGADAAIVVTASHNPPADNGYKLYLGDGLQIVAPADAEIAATIDRLVAEWHRHGPAIDDAFADLAGHDLRSGQEWIVGHRRAALEALFTGHREAQVAYTAMHGVGGLAVLEAFAAADFPEPWPEPSQFDPDPDFPTVPFPNPEEPGAFDRVIALAAERGAAAALANDPDADRLAMAVPGRDGGPWVALSGNELGALLADHVLRHTSGSDRLVARSVVSSRLLDAMAASAGVRCDVTLTGFKWVARPIVTEPGLQYVFGFEEAIGYCVGDRVRDKDGVTAALVAAEMLAELDAAGSSVWQRLDELAARHGVYRNHPISVRFDDDPTKVDQLMARFEAEPPTSLGGEAVTRSGPVGLGALPPTEGMHLLTDSNTQVIVRPSGTEPKLKLYVEVIEPVTADVAEARTVADVRLEAIVADLRRIIG